MGGFSPSGPPITYKICTFFIFYDMRKFIINHIAGLLTGIILKGKVTLLLTRSLIFCLF